MKLSQIKIVISCCRANLFRIVTDNEGYDSDGYGLEQRFLCSREQTMSQVGAHEDARFAIVTQDDETDTA